MSYLRKNWLRTFIIIGIFTAAGTAPFIIEQQMLPLVQLSQLVTNFYNPLTGDFSLETILDSILGINVIASTKTQTTLLITVQMQNHPLNFYPMKIPALNLDLYFKAGRPYDKEKQIIQQFKADPDFSGVKEPIYDLLSFSWVRTMNIMIPQEIEIPVGMFAPVNIIVNLYTNGKDENALSQMISTIIREEKIPGQRLFAKGEIFFMGVPIPISLEVPEFEMPVGEEEGGITDLLSTFFVDMKPETEDVDFFHLADVRNYDDGNKNFYRDWSDTINPNGLKDQDENFTEPLLENGTLSISPFVRLTSKLSIGGGSIYIPQSPWNIQEGQNETSGLVKYGDLSYWDTEDFLGETRYTPKSQIEDSIWGTADQQILLYCPASLAEDMNKPNWRNRIIGTVGFINNQSLSLDGHGSSVPLLLSADVKITGDARSNADFTAGDAINTFLPQLLDYGNVSLGIVGNIKVKLGEMPLSLVIKTEIEQDVSSLLGESSSNSQGQSLSSLQNNGGTGVSDLIPFIFNFFDLKNFIFNGLAMDVYHKVMQTNSTVDLDLFFPYGIYLPETEEETSNFLDLEGGPIQIFNESKPPNWDTLNLTFPYNIPDTVISEDFESYADDIAWHATPRWSKYDPGLSSNVTLVTTGGKKGSQGIEYTTDNTDNASIRKDFAPQDGISGFYFDIKLENNDGDFYATLHNKILQLLQLQFENVPGGNNLNFGTNTAYLDSSKWYRVYVTIDKAAGTYDVSVDGIVNQTFTPTGIQTQYPLLNAPSASDFDQVVAFNESDMFDIVFGDGATGTFQTSRRIRQLYYVENTEYFSCDGATYEFQITNEANTTGALALVMASNGTNTINYTYNTSPSVGGGYQYTFAAGSRMVRLFDDGSSHNLTSDYTVFISYFVEEDRITAPIDGTSVSITDANPSANTIILIHYHARDRDVFQYTTSPSSTGGYQFTWNPTSRLVRTYNNSQAYQIPSYFKLYISYNIGEIASDVNLINNIDATNLTLSMNNSLGPITIDNVNFRNEKTLKEAHAQWYQDHLVFNLTVESGSLKTLFSKILAKIGSYRNGMGIAYHFNSKHLIAAYGTSAVGYYSKVKDNIFDSSTSYPIGTMPTGNLTIDVLSRGIPDPKVPFSLIIDDLELNIKEIFPEYGPGLNSIVEQFGIDPLLTEYLNRSLDDWGIKSGKGSGLGGTGTLFDLLLFDITTLLSAMYQDGPDNDLFDYMIAKGYLNETYSALNLTALISSVLDLAGFEDLVSETTNGGGEDSVDIYAMIPELLQATNIDFDKLVLDLVDYLRKNMSYNQGIRPFELVDLFFSGTGTGTADLFEDINEESWYIIFEDIKSLLDIINPMELAQIAINNPLPFVDYLNRSGILSESVLLPLLTSIFGAGGEEEEFDWDKIFRNVDDLMSGLLFGVEIPDGIDEPWENKAINIMAFLQAAESILNYNPLTNETFTTEDALLLLANLYNTGQGLQIFTSGEGEYIADVPPYDNLNAMSDLVLWLMQSGFDAEDLYKLLADLGILDLTELSGGGSGDPSDITGGISALIPLLGGFCPPGEWLSLLRSMGIWSTWEGYFEMIATLIIDVIIIGRIQFDIDVAGILGRNLVNLEKMLATGIMELLPNFGLINFDFPFDFQLSLNENQSYGNPWYYQMGYDSSANLGPYHQGISGSPADCDNWGWVPLGWDPGGNPATNPGNPWGDPAKNWTSDKGGAYKKDLISLMISYLPLAIDLDLPTLDLEDIFIPILDWGFVSVDMILNMMFPLDLSVRLRMEGNPAGLVQLFEDSGISMLGFLTHLYPNANQWLYDAFGTLAGGGGGTTGGEDIIDFNQLDLTLFFDTYLSSGIDLYHVFQYLLDPDFLPTMKWYLDSGYMMWDINESSGEIENPTAYTLYWDYPWHIDPDNLLPGGPYNVTQTHYFGDNDKIPDEYPWYRFVLPSINQLNPHRGPGTYSQADIFRYPDMIDDITPIGYPGQGYYLQQPDGIPDGLQHYWFDTPYAYVNAKVNRTSDPWPNIAPSQWNENPGGQGYYSWTVGIDTYYWGENAPVPKGTKEHPFRPEFPIEQVPLINLPNSLWDVIYAPLYQSGSVPANPSISDINFFYPDIWDCFQYTLDQVDSRFGFWEYNSSDESIDGTGYDYLNCLPFWTLMSLGVSPHLAGAIDVFDVPGMMTDVTEAVSANLGADYWHKTEYNRTYRWFEPNWKYWDNMGFEYNVNTTENVNNSNLYWRGMSPMTGATTAFDEYQNLLWTDYGNGTLRVWSKVDYFGDLYEVDLNPFGLLQWIWEGAGDVITLRNVSGTYEGMLKKYLAPYSVPDLPAALNWLDGKGLSMNNILDMLPQIIEEFSGTGQEDVVSDLITVDTIVSIVQAMEDYFRRVPGTLNMTNWAENHDHDNESAYLDITQNRTRAAELILGMVADLPEVMDINPAKAARGLLSYLMPQLEDIFGEDSIGGEGETEDLLGDINDMLHDSGLVDIIFEDTSKIRNLAFDLSIQNTMINLTLSGWKFININLDDIEIPVNITEIGEEMEEENGDDDDLPISLPIDFAKPLPYIELSTFNGPYEVVFQALFNNGTPISDAEIAYGEVQYWENPTNRKDHSYYFNVTVYDSTRIGWFNELGLPDTPPNAIMYITNGTYEMTHTNNTGHLKINGTIVDDSFGWVDPYLYIHCEPIDPMIDFYWWNVTTNSTQLTLQDNREIGLARWVLADQNEVPDIVIQQTNPFNANVTNIDDDPWFEIFARVEIDDSNMDGIQKIFFMPKGDVDRINVSHGLDYNIRIWDSFEIQNKSWDIEGTGGNTKYIFEEVVTPDESTIIYPTGPKVITGIRVDSDNWIDDVLTKAQIFYYDLEDTAFIDPIYLLNWDIRKNGSWIEQNWKSYDQILYCTGVVSSKLKGQEIPQSPNLAPPYDYRNTFEIDDRYHFFENESSEQFGEIQVPYIIELTDQVAYDSFYQLDISMMANISYQNSNVTFAGWKIWNWASQDFDIIDANVFNSTTKQIDSCIITSANKSDYINETANNRIEVCFYVTTTINSTINGSVDYLGITYHNKRASILYQYNTDVWTQDEGGNEWSTSGSIERSGGDLHRANDWVTFQINETTFLGQQYAQDYRILDFDLFFSNFSQKTLASFDVWYNYYEVPEGDGYGSKKWLQAYSYDGLTTYPGAIFKIDRERRAGNPLILGYDNQGRDSLDPMYGYDLIWNTGNSFLNGSTSLPRERNTSTGAQYAIINYTIPIPADQFISQIDWNIVNLDNPNLDNAISVNCSVYYAGDANGQNAGWKYIQNSTFGETYSAGTHGGIWSRTIQSMFNVSGNYYDPFNKEHWLYLTSRGNDASENFTYIKFEILLRDNITHANGRTSNLGWNDTDPLDLDALNTPENVSVEIILTMYPFVKDWGVKDFELPTGVISGFHINARLWDPQGSQADWFIPAANKYFPPNITFSYLTVLVENGSRLTPWLGADLNALTAKVIVRMEMEDSIVLDDVPGGRGDSLYVDDNRTYGIVWVPLNQSYMPNVTTYTDMITIETDYLIEVDILANNAFRNYYLNLTLNNSRGYIELTRLVTLCDNTEVASKLGIFPPKAVIDVMYGYPHIYRLGTKIDINPSTLPYTIIYQLTFRPSATFLKDSYINGSSVVEYLWFAAVWDKPRGTFEYNLTWDPIRRIWKTYYFQNIQPTTEGNPYKIVRVQ